MSVKCTDCGKKIGPGTDETAILKTDEKTRCTECYSKEKQQEDLE